MSRINQEVQEADPKSSQAPPPMGAKNSPKWADLVEVKLLFEAKSQKATFRVFHCDQFMNRLYVQPKSTQFDIVTREWKNALNIFGKWGVVDVP